MTKNIHINKKEKSEKGNTGYIYFLGHEDANKFTSLVEEHVLAWQEDALRKNEREMVYFTGKNGPVWIIRRTKKHQQSQHYGILDDSEYSWSRELFGSLVGHFKIHQLKNVILEFYDSNHEQELGALTGLQIATYSYREIAENKKSVGLPQIYIRKSLGHISADLVKKSQQRAAAVNLARHFVNMPANELNPTSFVSKVKKMKWPANMKIQVWNQQRLQKEKMGLLLAVGQGAPHSPCLIHLSYRPKKKTKLKPVAFVGKGITFDTGGLDLKPSSAMRMMKKDMGGAASVLGLAKWVADSQYVGPCDFYLCLAENSVDGKSFHPGDVFKARNGLNIEIDNTDAEGRLVLADGLDVAVTRKGVDEPELVINVATLTGACRVALGVELAGLFSNSDLLAESLIKSGQKAGDANWRLPLVDKYFQSYSSHFADFKNSGEGLGGAITAALFLQKFVRGKPWAHLDCYAWADKAGGSISSPGGNGQAVQCLIEFLEDRS